MRKSVALLLAILVLLLSYPASAASMPNAIEFIGKLCASISVSSTQIDDDGIAYMSNDAETALCLFNTVSTDDALSAKENHAQWVVKYSTSSGKLLSAMCNITSTDAEFQQSCVYLSALAFWHKLELDAVAVELRDAMSDYTVNPTMINEKYTWSFSPMGDMVVVWIKPL